MINLEKPKTVYEKNGYKNRKDYLICLANDYGLPTHVVFQFASVLGSSEDFDGLISELNEVDPDDYAEFLEGGE